MNLEPRCAYYGGQIDGAKREQKARKRLETLVRQTLGVLREEGIYATYLFLNYRAKEGGSVILAQLLALWRDEAVGPLLVAGGSDREQVIALTEELDALLLARQVAERTLVYALYGLRAGISAEGAGEMAWQAITLTYRALAPVLLGGERLGFIERTRTYAPGWTLWGAITATLARATADRATPPDYQAVGRFVARNLPTSYAFVVVDGQAAAPHEAGGTTYYGPLSQAAFEARFLDSLGQTAVAPATMTADVATLHEAEALCARARDTGDPTRWRFTLYVRDPWDSAPPALAGVRAGDLPDLLAALTLGADRGCGLGRLALCDVVRRAAAGDAWPYDLDARSGDTAGPEAPITLRAHVRRDVAPDGADVRGALVAVPWRWWANDRDDAWGPGQRREVHLFYAPGGQILGAPGRPLIGAYGLWQWEAG